MAGLSGTWGSGTDYRATVREGCFPGLHFQQLSPGWTHIFYSEGSWGGEEQDMVGIYLIHPEMLPSKAVRTGWAWQPQSSSADEATVGEASSVVSCVVYCVLSQCSNVGPGWACVPSEKSGSDKWAAFKIPQRTLWTPLSCPKHISV